jgi:hypothetical protein
MVRLLRLLSAAALPEPILAEGCGGRGGLIITQQPIAVSLPVSTQWSTRQPSRREASLAKKISHDPKGVAE